MFIRGCAAERSPQRTIDSERSVHYLLYPILCTCLPVCDEDTVTRRVLQCVSLLPGRSLRVAAATFGEHAGARRRTACLLVAHIATPSAGTSDTPGTPDSSPSPAAETSAACWLSRRVNCIWCNTKAALARVYLHRCLCNASEGQSPVARPLGHQFCKS